VSGVSITRAADMRATIIISMCAILVTSCRPEPSCQNELRGSPSSPDGKSVAVIFSRNCGATVGDNCQVSIAPSGETPTGKGNILVADQAPAYSDRFQPVWNGSSSVTVPIPPGARVFAKTDNLGRVQVTFRQM
jgi:hypothetical protein